MKFDIITIFPHIFDSYFNESIIKRAREKKLIQVKIWNLRDFAVGKHKSVDDSPFGGGPGMALKIEPIIKAVQSLNSKIIFAKQIPGGSNKKSKIILFSARGQQFDNKMASRLAKNYERLILICGRYEGVDERVKKAIGDLGLEIQELSIGPYILTGGEVPAMVVVDAVSRHLPGVLGRRESLEEIKGSYPVYTRPEVFEFRGRKYPVPKMLVRGDHEKIERWRRSRGRS
ncbi:tRNA (guanosine(37)-N1)-methyltransferase TrmD [Candidatus Wolfebacteria bacterium]|nr:tRNA (guanosine(37)-N1)-methyltransferase TrmD [Candidatus Wolfebacteria bacterium]